VTERPYCPSRENIGVVRFAALAIALVLVSCSAPPAAAPSATASATARATVAAASASPSPTIAASSSPTLIPLPSTAQIDAPSGSVVWALVADRRLFRSTDRGDSWQERPAPAKLPVVLSFIDDHEGWALAGGSAAPPPGGACTGAVTLQHTSDAGATWQQLAATGLDPGPCKATVRFADALRGFIAAHDPAGSPIVYRTADGGLSWTASKRLADPPGFTTGPTGPTLGVGRIAIFGIAHLLTAFPMNPATGTMYAYRSTDGGVSWTYVAKAPDPLEEIAYVTATRWLQIGAPSQSKETTVTGATWHAYTTDYQQAAPVAPAVTFGDAQVGYATVRGAIQRTVDGGAHWTAIRTPGTF
jgi:photosystem II stability/assembly factor-like uncharacterized protein